MIRTTNLPRDQVSRLADTFQFDIGTSPTALDFTGVTAARSFVIKNNTVASAKVYIAFSAAKAIPAKGYPLERGESVGIDLGISQQTIYASCDVADGDVRLMVAGD